MGNLAGQTFVTQSTIGLDCSGTKTCFGIHVDHVVSNFSVPLSGAERARKAPAVIVNHDRAIIRATCHKE